MFVIYRYLNSQTHSVTHSQLWRLNLLRPIRPPLRPTRPPQPPPCTRPSFPPRPSPPPPPLSPPLSVPGVPAPSVIAFSKFSDSTQGNMDREVLTDMVESGGADRREGTGGSQAEWIGAKDSRERGLAGRDCYLQKSEREKEAFSERESERERERENVAGERQADTRALRVPFTYVGARHHGVGRDGEAGGREHVGRGRIECGGEGDFRRALQQGVRGGQMEEGSNSWFVPAHPNLPPPLPLPPARPPTSHTFQHADGRLWSSGYGLAYDERFGQA